MEETRDATTTKHRQQTFHLPISDKIIKKSVESEIDLLRMDELKGGTIDLQVYLSVQKPD